MSKLDEIAAHCDAYEKKKPWDWQPKIGPGGDKHGYNPGLTPRAQPEPKERAGASRHGGNAIGELNSKTGKLTRFRRK